MAAYAWIMVIILLLVGAVSYAYLIPAINKFTVEENKLIDTHRLSEQSVFVIEWNKTWFLAIPGIGLLGLAYWAITRSQEVSNAGRERYE